MRIGDIHHLYGLERLERRTRRQARSPQLQLLFECDLKAMGEKGHKDVLQRDAHAYDRPVVSQGRFQFFEGLLDLGELLSEGPEGCQSSPSLLVRRR